jgi:D-3-phosphoglycerate dehydrogenase
MNKNTQILITGSPLEKEAMDLFHNEKMAVHILPGIPKKQDILDSIDVYDPQALIIRTGIIDKEILDHSDNIIVIAKHGVGIDNIDADYAAIKKIPIIIAKGANALSVAEHALTLMLAVSKRIFFLDGSVRSGDWAKFYHRGIELSGKKVTLIGFGDVAKNLAKLLEPITALVSRIPSEEMFPNVHYTLDINEALVSADVVSIHCPLTPMTAGMISWPEFSKMKQTCILVNTARGSIVNEEALIEALSSGRIAGAGLDCFEKEPLPNTHPLMSLQNVILTPHVAWATHEGAVRMSCITAKNVIAILKGDKVDPIYFSKKSNDYKNL